MKQILQQANIYSFSLLAYILQKYDVIRVSILVMSYDNYVLKSKVQSGRNVDILKTVLPCQIRVRKVLCAVEAMCTQTAAPFSASILLEIAKQRIAVGL